MSKEEFLKLSDLDKVKYAIEEILKEHKGYKSEYWKGSAFMGNSILKTIEQVKKFAIPVVVEQSEQLCCETCKFNCEDWDDNHPCASCAGFEFWEAT